LPSAAKYAFPTNGPFHTATIEPVIGQPHGSPAHASTRAIEAGSSSGSRRGGRVRSTAANMLMPPAPHAPCSRTPLSRTGGGAPALRSAQAACRNTRKAQPTLDQAAAAA
jgi:hypothetical protein